ncbi:MAG: hypothetical protein LKH93_01700 [Clostridium beijerinckii]|uniref:hypothetical protein n=1 Tax=Clostridium diolis TaxID=223919 RepID=UPI000B3FAACD|nr:hypothetical protein [Clostridium diolis]MCI1578155.1 hypothetical protein [Clostridium beijerinckii]MCI1584726.1 hypothetical protein [Clostridium beijerinckii]MCI1620912.1 hypothetical protein [Clostridium beijerinckii]OVE66924.1 hypothetical protein CCS79_16720 [Clostridium diolis]
MRYTERFIRQWSKKRKKGKLKFILINSAIYCIVYWIVAILFILVRGKELHRLIENSDVFIIPFIIYIISLFRIWKKNEDKYNSAVNNK